MRSLNQKFKLILIFALAKISHNYDSIQSHVQIDRPDSVDNVKAYIWVQFGKQKHTGYLKIFYTDLSRLPGLTLVYFPC